MVISITIILSTNYTYHLITTLTIHILVHLFHLPNHLITTHTIHIPPYPPIPSPLISLQHHIIYCLSVFYILITSSSPPYPSLSFIIASRLLTSLKISYWLPWKISLPLYTLTTTYYTYYIFLTTPCYFLVL